jgi:hypothetical protein
VSADLASGPDHQFKAGAEALAGVPNVELRMFNHLNILKDMKSIQDRIVKKRNGCLSI